MDQHVMEFIEHNPVLMLASIGQDGKPRNRVMITLGVYKDTLWFAVTKDKTVYQELLKDNNVEICGVTLSRWIRIAGQAVFEKDYSTITHVIENSDIMEKFYKRKDQSTDDVAVFYIDISHGMLEDYDTATKIEF